MAINNNGFSVNSNAIELLSGFKLKVKDKKEGLAHVSDSIVKFLKIHFKKKDSAEPNKLGGKRTHFWKQIGRSVKQVQRYNTYNVAITDYRFNQKLYGGTITAKNAKYLTIPMKAASYGQTAGQFSKNTGVNLRFRRRRSGGGVLAGGRGRGTYYYSLVKSVTQQPWPNTLPTNERLSLRAQRSFRYWLKKHFGNAVN